MAHKDLRDVEYKKIENLTCLVVNAPIGKLSLKDSGRVIFKLCQKYIAIQKAYNKLVENVCDEYDSKTITKDITLKILNEKEENLEKLLQQLKKIQTQS